MPLDKNDSHAANFLLIYLLVVGIGAAVTIVLNFPGNEIAKDAKTFSEHQGFLRFGKLSPDQGLILLAFVAGVAGSFLHAGQSLITFVGNESFKASWTAWYLFRPWIGGVLGFAIYFALRAGLIGGASAVNPYGVVALGLLGGWFSKTTTDKLQEVFETLFKTDADKDRKDKLINAERPIIESVDPSPVPANQNDITIVGRNFMTGATLIIDGEQLTPGTVSDTELKVTLTQRPAAGTESSIQVKNPQGQEPTSSEFKVLFE